MDLISAADELYGVAPSEFVAARTRLVKAARAAGDADLARRIGGLRRPTPAAWAVNLLARAAPGDLAALLDVGADLRAAWASGSGLADLERRRSERLAPLVRRAAELAAEAGPPLRDQAVREVEETLHAATVDARLADQVRGGHLTRPRSHAGFVLAGLPTEPEAEVGRDKGEVGRDKGEVRRDEGEAQRARRVAGVRRRLEKAEQVLAGREARAAEAAEALREASAEVGRSRRALQRAVSGRDAAGRRAERAEAARERAAGAVQELRDELERDTPHGRTRAPGDRRLK